MSALSRKKLTTQKFIDESRKVHGDVYEYSQVRYSTTKGKVTIICRIHGSFSQEARYHLKGCGCPACGRERTSKSHIETLAKYLPIFKATHGDKYDYSKAAYLGADTPIEIVCSVHGSFWQSPISHRDHGCSKCAIEASAEVRTFTTEQFVDRAIEVHGSKYDYSLAKYEKSGKKVKLVCPDHGEFLVEANSHLQGKGCAKCGFTAAGDKSRYSLDTFVEKAKIIHGDKYDYLNVDYVNSATKVVITCKEHGDFPQTPAEHLSGRGCRKCATSRVSESLRLTLDQFVAKAIQVHGDRYSYANSVYVRSLDAMVITCPEHGDFLQKPNSHLYGNGCAKCSGAWTSKVEKKVAKFLSSYFDITQNTRVVIPPLELDSFIPELNLGVEFCGLYYHSEKFKDPAYHLSKLKMCSDKNIALIQIFEDEWMFKQEIVESVLKGRMGVLGNKIPARKSKIVELSAAETRDFLDKNHLQGYAHAEYKFGLQVGGELVMVATFSSKREIIGGLPDNWFELVRLCTKMDTVVVGGFKKLLAHFIKIANPSGIRSYCDLRYFSGSGYEAAGFTRIRSTKPNFYYVKGLKRFSRFTFQKHKLPSALPSFDPALSSEENLKANRYYRIYDCGSAVYELSIP